MRRLPLRGPESSASGATPTSLAIWRRPKRPSSGSAAVNVRMVTGPTPLTLSNSARWSLQRVLGLKSYQTAWTMLHRLRRAMVRPGRERLHGCVEVDETYIAITDRESPRSAAGRKSQTTKTLVAVAVEILDPKGFGRIRLKRIEQDSEKHLLPFVKDVIQPGTRVRTDGSAAYRNLAGHGYEHEPVVMQGSAVPAHSSMPGVHRVASLIKRWILGTHHGAVQPGQLDHYLDEFVFRFNRRTSRSRGLLFYRLLEQAVVTAPVTYDDVTSQSGS